MRITFVHAALIAVLAVAGPSAQARPESPFYCDLSKLSAADRTRKDAIGGHLASVRLGVRELPDGYEFQFPGDTATLQEVNEWVVTERLCCPFFDIDVRTGHEDGPVALRLTGRKGTKAFIKADFGRWLK